MHSHHVEPEMSNPSISIPESGLILHFLLWPLVLYKHVQFHKTSCPYMCRFKTLSWLFYFDTCLPFTEGSLCLCICSSYNQLKLAQFVTLIANLCKKHLLNTCKCLHVLSLWICCKCRKIPADPARNPGSYSTFYWTEIPSGTCPVHHCELHRAKPPCYKDNARCGVL